MKLSPYVRHLFREFYLVQKSRLNLEFKMPSKITKHLYRHFINNERLELIELLNGTRPSKEESNYFYYGRLSNALQSELQNQFGSEEYNMSLDKFISLLDNKDQTYKMFSGHGPIHFRVANGLCIVLHIGLDRFSYSIKDTKIVVRNGFIELHNPSRATQHFRLYKVVDL